MSNPTYTVRLQQIGGPNDGYWLNSAEDDDTSPAFKLSTAPGNFQFTLIPDSSPRDYFVQLYFVPENRAAMYVGFFEDDAPITLGTLGHGRTSVPLMAVEQYDGSVVLRSQDSWFAWKEQNSAELEHINAQFDSLTNFGTLPLVRFQIHVQQNGQWVPTSYSELRLAIPDPPAASALRRDYFACSVLFWTKLNDATKSVDVLTLDNGGNTNSGWRFHYEDDGANGRWVLSVRIRDFARWPSFQFTVTPVIAPSEWTHVAIVYNIIGHFGIYINGELCSLSTDYAHAISNSETKLIPSPNANVDKLATYYEIILSPDRIRTIIESERPGFLKSADILLSLPLNDVKTIPGTVGGIPACVPDDLLGPVLPLQNTSAYIEVPTRGWFHPSLDRLLLTFWCKINPGFTPSRFFAFGETGNLIQIEAHPEGFFVCVYRKSGTAILKAASRLATGVWTHIAVVFDGATLALYLNGRLDSQIPLTGKLPWAGNLVTGSRGSVFSHLSRIEFLRAYDTSKTLETLLAAKIDSDLGPVAVGNTATIPVEFTLSNENDEPSLVLEPRDQVLTVELRNTSGHLIDLPHPDTGHALELRFRPGALHPPQNAKILAPAGWTLKYTPEPDSTDTLLLHAPAGAPPLKTGEKLALVIAGLRPDPATGARTTRVQLRYHLSYGDRYPLQGSRVHSLSFVYALAATGDAAPLGITIVGDDTVVPDGGTRNNLKLRIFNRSNAKLELCPESEFRFYIDRHDKGAPLGLFANEDRPTITPAGPEKWTLVDNKDEFQFVLQKPPIPELTEYGHDGSFFDFGLNNFICHGDIGPAMLRVEFLNVGKPNKQAERQSGILTVPVRRGNAIQERVGRTVTHAESAVTGNATFTGSVEFDGPVTFTSRSEDGVPHPTTFRQEAHFTQAVDIHDRINFTPRDFTQGSDQPYIDGGAYQPNNTYLNLTAQDVFLRGKTVRIQGDDRGNFQAQEPSSYSYDPSAKKVTGSVIPRGGIILWSGSYDKIPFGWALCDGNQHGDVVTPNLTDKFVLGAGQPGYAKRSVGESGGAETVWLTTANVPPHKHAYKNVVVSPGNQHKLEEFTRLVLGGADGTSGVFGEPQDATTDYNDTGYGYGQPAQGFSIMPLYYALCYIIKL